jgi:hypothetical protein
MKELLPIEAYRESLASVSLARLGWILGAFFGLLLGLGLLGFTAALDFSASPLSSWALLGAVALSGAVFGMMFPRSLKRRLMQSIEAVYSGTGSYATRPPDGVYTHRLACSLRDGRWEIGGALYLGTRLATFVPHAMNLPQHRQPVTLTEGAGCEVRIVGQPRTFRSALIGIAPPDLIEITSPWGTWRFNTPVPTQTASEVRALLAG